VTTRARLCVIVLVLGASTLGACGTVDLGDNIVAPDLQLDEDFFYCRVQPECIDVHSCAGGGAGEGGMCHTARSSLRLMETVGIAPPTCEADRPTSAVPPEYVANLDAVEFTVQSDPLSSPFYRRPTGLDSHPRQIFPEDDPCAQLFRDWIARGSL
jgi:hypothetical protein